MKRIILPLILSLATLTATAQHTSRDLNRTVLYISYSAAFIDKTFTPKSDAPGYVTFEKIPCAEDCTIPMNCTDMGLEGFIHPAKSSNMFISVGSRFQISKGSKLMGKTIRYKNQAETFKIITPICVGYDFELKKGKLFSPSVGAVMRYTKTYTDEYYQFGFSNFLLSKKMTDKDGLNNIQYGIRAGFDISGQFITLGLQYTYDLTPLMDSHASLYVDEQPTYYGVHATTSEIQVKFGFVFGRK